MLKPMRATRPIRGFSLVEMMVAIVAGMVLVAATLTLVVANVRANTQNIRSVRVTQELRALTAVITQELRRARYSADALGNIGLGAAAINPFNVLAVTNSIGATNDDDASAATTDGDCVQYAYQDAPGGPFRTIALAQVAGRGEVRISRSAVAPSPACNAAGAVLSSPEVNVTRLTFNYNCARDAMVVTVEGSLVGEPVRRRYSEIVRVRSVPIGGCGP
jgi:Tfp pilus assembly protein PilW